MDPWAMGQRGGRMAGGGGGGRRPESSGRGSSFAVAHHQPFIRAVPSSQQQQGNSYYYPPPPPPPPLAAAAAAATTTTIPSLSSGQSFYTVESLEGATMLPTPGIFPPPFPSLLLHHHDNRGGGGGAAMLGFVGDAAPVVMLPKPYSALHWSNARQAQYGAEQKENGVFAPPQQAPPLLPTPMPYPPPALHLHVRPHYGAEQVGDRSSYMDRERELHWYNNGQYGLYPESAGPSSLPHPNSLGFAFGWPTTERDQQGGERQKGRRDRDLRAATEKFQGRGPGNRSQSTNPVIPPPTSAPPPTPRNIPAVSIKPKKKPVPVLGPGGVGWCAKCEVECKTADMLQQHLAGKRHHKNAIKLESEVDGGSQNAADGSQPAASSSENASGLGKRSATTDPAEDDGVVTKKPRPVDNMPALSSDAAAAPEQCEQESDVGCRSSGISSTTMPLSATTVKSSNSSDDRVTTSNGVAHAGGGGDGSRTLNGGSDTGTTSNGDGDGDGCTTSTITVEKVTKSDRDEGYKGGDKEDKDGVWKTMPPEDLVRSDIGEAVKLLEVLIDNR